MEGKINYDELSENQRQFDRDFILDLFDDNIHHFREPNEEEIYHRIKCSKKVLRVFIFLIFGNCYFIIGEFRLYDYSYLGFIIYILLSLALFFQMIFLNILSLLMVLIFIGFKKFILIWEEYQDLFLKKFILILVNILFGTFCKCYYLWKKLINETDISNIFWMQFLIFFPCAIMSIFIYYPQRLLINIVCIIIYYIKDRRFSRLLSDLDDNFNNAFNFRIHY
jgi:hypothetical protein